MLQYFYEQKQLLLSERLSHRKSVRPSHGWISQKRCKSSPSAAWKTLVSGTVKLFHKFKRGHHE